MHKANVADTSKKEKHGNNVGKLQVVHDYKKCIAGVRVVQCTQTESDGRRP